MKRTMMFLPDDLHAFLAEDAASRGVSMAEVAREAISEFRARRASEEADPLAIAGLWVDPNGPDDLSEHVGDALMELGDDEEAWR